MRGVASQHDRYQEQVNSYFQSSASCWGAIYERHGLFAQIYRRRQSTTLDWIAQLQLRPGSRVLEIGCGAGFLSTALARAGYAVEAIDPLPAMVEVAQQNAISCGVASHMMVSTGDAHALSFGAEQFDLVVALGVLPWLHSELVAVSEMQRVLRPGGYLLLTADNKYRLNRVVDPISTPAAAPLRAIAKRMLNALGIRRSDQFYNKLHSPGEIDRMLEGHALVKIRSKTLGFRPFSFCGRVCFSEAVSIRIDRTLQRLVDLGIAPLCIMGSDYVVLAMKPCR